ncbi:hypothetical protein GCM10007049_04780 [Echinicola pacifica]|uniref:Uncharacterized protein n=1 Tax=Echinicola pacifica TaxID=346377 RepID=A0A918PLX3_9BACT|nr:hypothetical protein GCM10007049_04780 [Echinicola pacifica]
MKKILPLFIPVLSETKEMEYQFEQKYIMSDKKFRQRFPDFKSCSYPTGVNHMVNSFIKL